MLVDEGRRSRQTKGVTDGHRGSAARHDDLDHGVNQPPRVGGVGRGTGAGAAGLRQTYAALPGAEEQARTVDDGHQVDVAALGGEPSFKGRPDHRQVHGLRVDHLNYQMWVANIDRGQSAVVGPPKVDGWSLQFGPRTGGPQVHGGQYLGVGRASEHRHPTGPGVGTDDELQIGDTVRPGDSLTETTEAVAAHLSATAVPVEKGEGG